jgi:hypothetical protein
MLDSLNYIMNLHDKIIEICHTTNIKMIITDEQENEFKNSTHCYLCNKKFFDENDKYYEDKENKKIKDKKNKSKVRDHDHLNGLYRGAAHYSCNLKCNWIKYIKVPVIAHNAKGYDSHFIFQYAGLLKNKLGMERSIKVIPLTDEKYLSFNIDKAVFLDSLQFMGPTSSLEKLVEALNKSNNNNLFKNFNEGFNNINDELNILLR